MAEQKQAYFLIQITDVNNLLNFIQVNLIKDTVIMTHFGNEF